MDWKFLGLGGRGSGKTHEAPTLALPNPNQEGAHYVPYQLPSDKFAHFLAYRDKYFHSMIVEKLADTGQTYRYDEDPRPVQTVGRGMILIKIATADGSASSEWMSLVHYALHNELDEPPNNL